ncbi:MAG: 4Fe-4S binding protein [Succinivibrionaceae bacterium]
MNDNKNCCSCTSNEGNNNLVAFIACAGHAAGQERLKNCKSCAEAVSNGFKRGECTSGCVGVGSCVNVCKTGALSVVDGKIIVDREKCNGCGDCAKESVCPQHLIRMIPRDATNFIPCSSTEEEEQVVRQTCGFGCISCGECERACPVGAATIIDNHAVIDYSKCVGCSACTLKCKKKIIVDTQHDLRVLKNKVAFVKCSEGKKAKDVYDKLGITDCHEAMRVNPQDFNLCTSGCCGLGNCTKVCRFGAISIVDGVAWVDPEKCVGCRDCIFECPKHLIKIISYKGTKLVPCSSKADYKDKAKVCDSGCIACEECVNNCPNDAIYMEDQHASIASALCENCHVCQYVCGRNVIKEMKVPVEIDIQISALDHKDEGAER